MLKIVHRNPDWSPIHRFCLKRLETGRYLVMRDKSTPSQTIPDEQVFELVNKRRGM